MWWVVHYLWPKNWYWFFFWWKEKQILFFSKFKWIMFPAMLLWESGRIIFGLLWLYFAYVVSFVTFKRMCAFHCLRWRCVKNWLINWCVFVLMQAGVMQTHDEETRKFFKHSSVTCVLAPRYGSSKLGIFKQQAGFVSII